MDAIALVGGRARHTDRARRTQRGERREVPFEGDAALVARDVRGVAADTLAAMTTDEAENGTPLEPNDPESEACFDALVAQIRRELDGRIAVGDDTHTAEGRTVLSELIADAILDVFTVRPRTERRYQPSPEPPFPK